MHRMERYGKEVKASCVPVLSRIGQSGWFAVGQSTSLRRAAGGEGAYVNYPALEGRAVIPSALLRPL